VSRINLKSIGKTKIKIRVVSLIIVMILTVFGCGKPKIDLTDAPYNPKITVEGYLYPGQTVTDIKLMRNFSLGNSIDPAELYLTPSMNNVSATINGMPLSFDPQTKTYFNNQITIAYETEYTLEVYATIDGTKLHTTSTTLTPQKGFMVLKNNLGVFTYGDSIIVNYVPSQGTGFYVFSIIPDTTNTKNFIYNNNNLRKTLDSSDVANNLNQYKFRYGVVDNIDSYLNKIYTYNISSRNTWFYSSYIVIAYACDENFKDFILTAPNVQEIDGNFHEPVEIFQGDGIGVFGSAIADTLSFTIIK
jgi:hypothetical protein